MPTATPPTIVLAVDGLRAAALGAYGQTTYETPGFDALAAEALTYDWCYAPTPSTDALYQRVADGFDQRSVVMTDDPAAVAPLRTTGAHTLVVPPGTANSVAQTLEESTAAAVWGAFTEYLVELADGQFPDLLWVHTSGLYGPWDAPSVLFEPLVEEGDPEVIAAVAAPHELFDDNGSTAACDARFAAACRYAAQVIALDACVASWLDVLAGLMEGADFRLVLAGLRGFPLGEHGQIGGVDPRLYSEQQHVPLLVCDPNSAARFTRNAAPTRLDATLLSTLACDSARSDRVALRSNAAQALATSEWMARSPTGGEPELYAKPDDRWEQNDVASLERETTETMLATLAAEFGVATPGDEV